MPFADSALKRPIVTIDGRFNTGLNHPDCSGVPDCRRTRGGLATQQFRIRAKPLGDTAGRYRRCYHTAQGVTPARSYRRADCDEFRLVALPARPTAHLLLCCACDIGEACTRDPLSRASLPQLPRAAGAGVVPDLLPDLDDVSSAGQLSSSVNPKPPPEAIHAKAVQLDLDRPIPIRYAKWVSGAVRGDFGATVTGHPVSQELWRRDRGAACDWWSSARCSAR